MDTGKILLGVLAGLAAGATLGILLAPDKGSVTRRKINDKSDEYAEELKKKFNEFYTQLTDKFEQAKVETEDYVAKAKAKFNGIKNEVEA